MNGRNRWFVLAVFLLSNTLNYLDRQALVSLAPLVIDEFKFSNRDYGLLSTAFSIAYAAGAPLSGMVIDRLGLTRGSALSVAGFSVASILTGLTRGLPGLVTCRAFLGLAQSGIVPAAGKSIRLLLRPEERALGNSFSQTAIALGMIVSPPLSVAIASAAGWRTAFMVIGLAGLLWIPLWRWVAPRDLASHEERGMISRAFLADRRPWVFALANACGMFLYALWATWTVLYLTRVTGATLERAAWFAVLPPLSSTLGAFTGGWLSLRLMRTGTAALPARLRVCWAAAVAALSTAAIPWLPGTAGAAAGISLSFFAAAAFSVNMYSMPLDAFGAEHAAFAIALLTSSYGAMHALTMPLVGWVVDLYGYAPVCVAASLAPMAACALLKGARLDR